MAKQAVEKTEYARGLEGVVTNETAVGYVDGVKGQLVYRGYSIEDLAEHSSYEETAYLLLFGKLPTQQELDGFKAKLVSYRSIPGQVIDVLKALPRSAHPMAMLRTGISALGCFNPKADQATVENDTEIGFKLIAQMATVTAAVARIRKGVDPVDPDPSLDHTANFLYMAGGEKADPFITRVMDVALILHADHGNNASTFSCMAVNSSLSDLYSAIVAGIGSLKGPLHGGANEQALKELLSIGSQDRVDDYVKKRLEEKKKFIGFGHRVYKTYDPRAKILGRYSKEVTERKGMDHLHETARRLEEQVVAEFGERGIFTNVDFYSGTIYHSLGFEAPMFTTLFAVSRIAGWVARILEYLPENRLFRPRALYVGELEAHYIPIDQR